MSGRGAAPSGSVTYPIRLSYLPEPAPPEWLLREIEPGELIAIDEHGLRSSTFAAPDPKGCLFEYVYLARPDTTISGNSVHAVRVEVVTGGHDYDATFGSLFEGYDDIAAVAPAAIFFCNSGRNSGGSQKPPVTSVPTSPPSVMFVNVGPPLVLTCHCAVGVGLPVAAAVNDATIQEKNIIIIETDHERLKVFDASYRKAVTEARSRICVSRITWVAS